MLSSPRAQKPHTLTHRTLATLGLLGLLSTAAVVAQPGEAFANGCDLAGVDGTLTNAGESSNPFAVADEDDLKQVGSICGLDKNYKQTEEIILVTDHAPIGEDVPNANNAFAFSGEYDGGGHPIKGLNIDSPSEDNVGLFGYTLGATLHDIHVVGADISGNFYVGTLVGRMIGGSLSNSSASGTLDLIGKRFTGGLVGGTWATNRSSGISPVFISSPEIRDSEVTGVISIEATEYSAGGITALFEAGEIVNTHVKADGTIKALDGGEVGGVVGGLYPRAEGASEVSQSSVSGNLTVSATSWAVGGFVGYLDNDDDLLDNPNIIHGSFVGEAVSVSGSADHVGGFVGMIGYEEGGTITNSYTLADVDGSNDVGGFVGRIEYGGAITNSYSVGSVTGSGSRGGFAGVITGGTITNSFWDVDTSGLGTADSAADSAGGRGKSTDQMTSFATFSDDTATVGLTQAWPIVNGWAEFAPDADPAVIWGICEGDIDDPFNGGYPYLLWQESSDPCVTSDGGPVSGAPSSAATQPAIHLDLQATSGDVVAGAPVLIEGQGLQPGSAYSVVLRSTPVTVKTGTVSGGGSFSNVVNLPAGIAPGTHTLTLTAIGANGSTLSLVTTFVVTNAGTFSSITPGSGTVVGGLAATGPNSSALTLGLGSSMLLLALGVAAFTLGRRKADFDS
jgi:hypothetical protein